MKNLILTTSTTLLSLSLAAAAPMPHLPPTSSVTQAPHQHIHPRQDAVLPSTTITTATPLPAPDFVLPPRPDLNTIRAWAENSQKELQQEWVPLDGKRISFGPNMKVVVSCSWAPGDLAQQGKQAVCDIYSGDSVMGTCVSEVGTVNGAPLPRLWDGHGVEGFQDGVACRVEGIPGV